MKKTNIFNKTIIFSVILLFPLTAQASSLPPDPNNAALLYYQAFLVVPEPDYYISQLVHRNTTEKIYEYLKGAKLDPDPEEKIKEIEKSIRDLELKKGISPDPNEQLSPREKAFYLGEHFIKEQRIDELYLLKESLEHHKKMRRINPNKVIREYLNECGQSIALAKAASEIQKCDWGYLFLKQYGSFSTQLMIETRKLGIILRADAMRLTADGDYRAALERCLMMRRLTRHLGGARYFNVSTQVDANALKLIQFILGYMKPDTEILSWLKKQIAIDPLDSESLPAFIKQNFEHYIWAINIGGKYFPWLRQQLADKATNGRQKKQALDLTNEQLLRLVREPYAEFVDSVLDVLASDISYKQKYRRIEKLGGELNEKAKENPAINLAIRHEAGGISGLYGLRVVHTAHINALKTAIEIYLNKAKTGQLPDVLPDGLPKDPYSGKDFDYKITKDSFILRCRVKPIGQDEVKQFEFKVKK
ncbi:MAG: hypothetical protein ACFFDT_33530 [Candidatus Hodarchaeota archaeon]